MWKKTVILLVLFILYAANFVRPCRKIIATSNALCALKKIQHSNINKTYRNRNYFQISIFFYSFSNVYYGKIMNLKKKNTIIFFNFSSNFQQFSIILCVKNDHRKYWEISLLLGGFAATGTAVTINFEVVCEGCNFWQKIDFRDFWGFLCFFSSLTGLRTETPHGTKHLLLV
jgi:hypothetical protein